MSQATTRAPRRPAPQRIRPGVQRMLDAITGLPAFVRNGRLEIFAQHIKQTGDFIVQFGSHTQQKIIRRCELLAIEHGEPASRVKVTLVTPADTGLPDTSRTCTVGWLPAANALPIVALTTAPETFCALLRAGSNASVASNGRAASLRKRM